VQGLHEVNNGLKNMNRNRQDRRKR